MSDHDPTDPICPASEVPGNGCLCAWLKAARADERERIAQAIEDEHDRWDPTDYDRGWMDGKDDAARIARNGGSDG